MNNKFNLLYEHILKECLSKNTNRIITESATRIPMMVKDAIAEFISDYLWQDLNYVDWPEDEWFSTFSDLRYCGNLWNSDEDIQEHYSNPLDAYYNLADCFVQYDKKSNTVTMDIDRLGRNR
jgi:hypothetical protein